MSFVENAHRWKSLAAVVKIESTRYIKSAGKKEKQTRFYITSSNASAEEVGKAVRAHWGIENQLHWQLDVSFSEDQSRKRDGHAAQNFFHQPNRPEFAQKRTVKEKRFYHFLCGKYYFYGMNRTEGILSRILLPLNSSWQITDIPVDESTDEV